MPGVRQALVIASARYDDPELSQLRAPSADAEALAAALGDPDVGDFAVTSLLDEPSHVLAEQIEDFFTDRSPEDLLLLHLSCHGVKDESGDLYFAAGNTKRRRLAATAISAEFVKRLMGRCLARRIVLVLDCCYSGAFERGMLHRGETTIDADHFSSGRGRAVITASSSMEYAFEGAAAAAELSVVEPSIFTGAFVRGLTTGEADLDRDGVITIEELYHYVAEEVRRKTPHQSPRLSTIGLQDQLIIARSSATPPAELPGELVNALASELPSVRLAVIGELGRILRGPQPGLASAARESLRGLLEDDSARVRAEAARALESVEGIGSSVGVTIAPGSDPKPVAVPEREPVLTPGPVPTPQPDPGPEAKSEAKSEATPEPGPHRAIETEIDFPSRMPHASRPILELATYGVLLAVLFALSFGRSAPDPHWLNNDWVSPFTLGPPLALGVAIASALRSRGRPGLTGAGLMLGLAIALFSANTAGIVYSIVHGHYFSYMYGWVGAGYLAPSGVLCTLLVIAAVRIVYLAPRAGASVRSLSSRGRRTLVVVAWATVVVFLADLFSNGTTWSTEYWPVNLYLALPLALAATALSRGSIAHPVRSRLALTTLCGATAIAAIGTLYWLVLSRGQTSSGYTSFGLGLDAIAFVLLAVSALGTGWFLLHHNRADGSDSEDDRFASGRAAV